MKRLYSSSSLENAKTLRSNQTDCENIIWQNLRAKRLNNIKFRRQVPIGKYIVDFVNLDKKLVIELDGSQHLDAIQYDNNRTEYLTNLGYKVVRFNNNDIINNLESVLNKIVEEYNKL
ncbi:MAG: endonuclease domain-containing protein [Candidatus Gastranaerophilaceae bacterium]